LAGFGQAQVPARTVQQARAQRFFQLRHVLAGHWRGDRQALGGGDEAAGVHHFPEHAQTGQTIHHDFLAGNEPMNRSLSISLAEISRLAAKEQSMSNTTQTTHTTQRLPTYFISHGGGPWPWMKKEMGHTYDKLE